MQTPVMAVFRYARSYDNCFKGEPTCDPEHPPVSACSVTPPVTALAGLQVSASILYNNAADRSHVSTHVDLDICTKGKV